MKRTGVGGLYWFERLGCADARGESVIKPKSSTNKVLNATNRIYAPEGEIYLSR
jgi:hypothetical protein